MDEKVGSGGKLKEVSYEFETNRGNAVFGLHGVTVLQNLISEFGASSSYIEIEFGKIRCWCAPKQEGELLNAFRRWERQYEHGINSKTEIMCIASNFPLEGPQIERIAQVTLEDGIIDGDEQEVLSLRIWDWPRFSKDSKAKLRARLDQALDSR